MATAVVAAIVVVVVGRSSGWPRTRDSFFNLRVGWHDLPDLFRALWVNVQIMVIAEVLVLVLAAVVATLRTLRGPVFLPVRFLAALYVDVFRGLPLLIVLYLVGYGIPSLRIAGAPKSPFTLAIIALVLTYTAYVAEGVPRRHRLGAPEPAGQCPRTGSHLRAVDAARGVPAGGAARPCRRCSTTS